VLGRGDVVVVEVAAAVDEPSGDEPVLEQPGEGEDDGCEKVKGPGGGEHGCAANNGGCEPPACAATNRACDDPVVEDPAPDTPVEEPVDEPDLP